MKHIPSGFYTLTPDERLNIVCGVAGLDKSSRNTLRDGIGMGMADSLVENCIGVYGLPLGVATNFTINGKSTLIPMVTEEPSVIAAASAGAKHTDDIKSIGPPPHIIGQIQILDYSKDMIHNIRSRREDIIDAANGMISSRMSVVGVDYTILTDTMMKVEIVVDAGEAMGANAVNTMCECVAPLFEEITGGRVLLRILSNNPPGVAHAEACFDVDTSVAEDIIHAYEFALYDGRRAVTHNKGIMNGISAVGMATGQDTRALEAGAHEYASNKGKNGYGPLSKWEMREGGLYGEISIPLRVGVVGGLTKHHPAAFTCLNMMGNPSAVQLSGIMAAVGLCQNFSALKALSTDGIQKGHMNLHKRRLG